MNYKETDDIWRLYRREWIAVHTLDEVQAADATPVFEAGRTWAQENLAGRMRDDEYNLSLTTDGHGRFWGQVMVYKDNLKGEFKHYGHAERHAREQDYEEYTIVPRNSKADHDLRSYGIKKL